MTRPAPPALPIGTALQHSDAWASLARRVRESQDRFDAIRPQLPAELLPHVRPGPLDERGWALLADGSAVAAKLRHLVPQLAAALQSAGWPEVALRVRILKR